PHASRIQRRIDIANDGDRFVERAPVAHGQFFEQHRRVAAPLRFGRRMPAPADTHPLARQQPLHDQREKRAERSPSFVAAQDCVIVLDQSDHHDRAEVLGVRTAQSCPAAHTGNDALHKREIRAKQLLSSILDGIRIPETFGKRGKTLWAVALPLRIAKPAAREREISREGEDTMTTTRKLFVSTIAITAVLLSTMSVRAEQPDKYTRPHEPFTAPGMQVRMSIVNPINNPWQTRIQPTVFQEMAPCRLSSTLTLDRYDT